MGLFIVIVHIPLGSSENHDKKCHVERALENIRVLHYLSKKQAGGENVSAYPVELW